jgi:hypothetical protein
MRRVLIILVVVAVGIAVWTLFRKKPKEEVGQKLTPVTVSKYSAAFNQSVNSALEAYYKLAEAFVTWDSAAIPAQASALTAALDSLKLADIQKDTVIAQTADEYVVNAKADVEALKDSSDLTDKRHMLNSLSDNLFTFLRIVQFDGGKIYMHECKMAFNDAEPGRWLSNKGTTEEQRNPYLGLHHPTYSGAMLTCGDVKDSINFIRL